MSGVVTRRRLFLERTVRRPQLPVWSLHFTKPTKAWVKPDRWPLKLPWVFKEAFPVHLEDSSFQDDPSALSPDLWWFRAAATEVFGRRPCFIDLWVFPHSYKCTQDKNVTAAYRKRTIFQMCRRSHSWVNNEQPTCTEMFAVLRRTNLTRSSSLLFWADSPYWRERRGEILLWIKLPNHGRKNINMVLF